MSLAKKQIEFATCVGELLQYIDGFRPIGAPTMRFGVTFGDAYRDSRVFGRFGQSKGNYSSKNSCHKLRLAIDLNLFSIDGAGKVTYLTKSSDHAPFGDFWKTLNQDARWGGDFRRPDGNHYSFTHWGVA